MLTSYERQKVQKIADNLKRFEATLMDEYITYREIDKQQMLEVFGITMWIRLSTKHRPDAIY